ncbi:MAG: hypothetical protein K2X03_20875 [Bryobacteraceae bacterium]|nr:hypothetical protein [Bryobacteraceae bacterium]
MSRLSLLWVAVGVLLAGLSGSYVLPLDHEAIQYERTPVRDAAWLLQQRLDRGETTLRFDSEWGYLPAVLDALQVPRASQTVVFTKTSLQAPRISPRNPRAIYFNDSVSVGWVPTGEVVEIAAQDPRQGVIFYTLDQVPTAKPRFKRRDDCLQCHATGATLGVPGLVVRSVYPEPSGMPLFQAGGFVTDHRSPLKERWGGWYVTGKHGDQRHMGNAFARDRERPTALDTEDTQNVTSLKSRFDTGAFLAPTSDIVALLVLEHQSHMTNLITRVGFETRMALHSQTLMNRLLKEPADTVSESTERRIRSAAEELVDYLLFVDEAPLTAPIQGASNFSAQFAARGRLREFDLRTRLFRIPVSYLVESEAFRALPPEALLRIDRRIRQILDSRETKYARLTIEDRRNIRETLKAQPWATQP